VKNCAFQYATCRDVLKDTGLITKEEADALWGEYLPKFKSHLKEGLEPEMAIWTDMKEPGDYRVSDKWWHASEFIEKDGELYRLESMK
jgi:hypothetical protein